MCQLTLPPECIHADEGTARCPKCGEWKLTDLKNIAAVPVEIDIGRPPRGAWFKRYPGGWRIGARSSGVIINGLSFALIAAAVTTVALFVVDVPLFQQPANNFLLLIAAGPLLIAGMLLRRFKVEVRVGGYAIGLVFEGVVVIGRYHRFDPMAVTDVRPEFSSSESRPGEAIVIDGPILVRFGGSLSNERREFLRRGLQVLLVDNEALIEEIGSEFRTKYERLLKSIE